MHIHILLINPLIPRREIHMFRYANPFHCNFNPPTPRREIQQYCIKICHYTSAVLPKIICFPCLLPQKFSKFQELTAKTIPISVRIPHIFYVSFQFAPEWHLLSIAIYYTHITSPLPILCIYYTQKIMIRYFCT